MGLCYMARPAQRAANPRRGPVQRLDRREIPRAVSNPMMADAATFWYGGARKGGLDNVQHTDIEGAQKDFRVGNTGLLSILNQRFLVTITEVDEDSFMTSFVGADYPLAGMWATLEFHDEEGANTYPVRVLAGPMELGGGVKWSRPQEMRRVQYRQRFRVSTDLTIQVKDQAHVRRYDAALINLSAGGALVRTKASLSFDAMVDVTLNLPEEPNHQVLARVVHINQLATGPNAGETLYGLSFHALSPPVQRSIQHYIQRRMAEMYL